MKNFKQKIVGFTLILGALMCMPANAIANMNGDLSFEVVSVVKENLIGGW